METIFIDDRESKKRQEDLKKIFLHKGYDVKTERLEIGDIVHENVCVEIKEASDLLSSIMNDDHLLRQIVNMIKDDVKLHLLIIGDIDEAIDKRRFMQKGQISLEHYLSFMAQISQLIPIMFVKNNIHAGKYIVSLIKHESDTVVFPMKSITTNSAINVLTSIKGIGVKQSVKICDTLDLNCVQDLMEMKKEDLLTVDKIGSKKADLIIKNIFGG